MPLKRAASSSKERDTDSPPQQKRKLSNPPEYESRLVDSTTHSAVEALMSHAALREKKRAQRAAETGKKLGDFMASEVFLYMGLTLKEPPLKTRLRPYTM